MGSISSAWNDHELMQIDDTLSCHSSTPKSEVIAFIEKYIGQTIVLHYENNLYPTWGDDDTRDIFLDDEGMKLALVIIEKHYIHGAWLKK